MCAACGSNFEHMLRFKHKAAICIVLCLLSGRLGAASSGLPACLRKKDAKRVEKAGGPEKRLLIFAGIAQRTAARLWYCLSPWANTWREGTVLGLGAPSCSAVEDALAAVDCAEQGIAQELAAWTLRGLNSEAALRKAQYKLALAESELGYAEVEAERLTLGLRPVVPSQIKARRHALEDLELRINQFLKERLPAQGSR